MIDGHAEGVHEVGLPERRFWPSWARPGEVEGAADQLGVSVGVVLVDLLDDIASAYHGTLVPPENFLEFSLKFLKI